MGDIFLRRVCWDSLLALAGLGFSILIGSIAESGVTSIFAELGGEGLSFSPAVSVIVFPSETKLCWAGPDMAKVVLGNFCSERLLLTVTGV